jgi:hypothetical protein
VEGGGDRILGLSWGVFVVFAARSILAYITDTAKYPKFSPSNYWVGCKMASDHKIRVNRPINELQESIRRNLKGIRYDDF